MKVNNKLQTNVHSDVQLLNVLQNAVSNKKINQIGHANSVTVCSNKPQQVDTRCTMSLCSQQVIECALHEGVAREVSGVIGHNRCAYDMRVVDAVQCTCD